MARAKTEDGKLQRFVAAIKEARFMARYENDARSRGKRRLALKKHWQVSPRWFRLFPQVDCLC